MLLKNFGSLLAGTLNDGSGSIAGLTKGTQGQVFSSYTTSNGKTAYQSVDGDDYISKLKASYNSSIAVSSGVEYLAIILGDGDTPPTVDDYKLSGNLIDTVKTASTSNADAFNITTSSTGFTITGQITNTGTEPVTVKEIALAQSVFSSTFPMTLLTRDILPEPIVLQAGEGKVFSIEIDTMSFVEQQVLQGDN